jgi:hypothetical protein
VRAAEAPRIPPRATPAQEPLTLQETRAAERGRGRKARAPLQIGQKIPFSAFPRLERIYTTKSQARVYRTATAMTGSTSDNGHYLATYLRCRRDCLAVMEWRRSRRRKGEGLLRPVHVSRADIALVELRGNRVVAGRTVANPLIL